MLGIAGLWCGEYTSEMLTYKSDDVTGRSKVYEAIIKGGNLPEPGIPESFNVLLKELQGLCLDVLLETIEQVKIRCLSIFKQKFITYTMAFKTRHKRKRFAKISINLASTDSIVTRSYGEVLKPETINYRTFKPDKDGLFCEKIFGPVRDWECHCGKYKGIRYKGIVCDRCGVEINLKSVRRERMGHITLSVPVVHIWYFRSMPSKIGQTFRIHLRIWRGSYITKLTSS